MIDSIKELLGMAKKKNEEKRKQRNKGASTYEPPKMKHVGGRGEQLKKVMRELGE